MRVGTQMHVSIVPTRNDFIIVGPAADPAHVKGGHDSVAALRAIDETKAPFVSRGDRSGTNAMELRLWKAAGIDPGKEGAGTWPDRPEAAILAKLENVSRTCSVRL